MSSLAPGPGGRWPLVAVLATLAVAGQLYGLYRPSGPPSPSWFPHADKLEHTLGFAVPVGLVLLAWGLRARRRGERLGRQGWVLVLAVAGAHAVVSELIQDAFYTYRSGDPLDALADLTGTALGALAALALLRRPGQGSRVTAPAERTGLTGR